MKEEVYEIKRDTKAEVANAFYSIIKSITKEIKRSALKKIDLRINNIYYFDRNYYLSFSLKAEEKDKFLICKEIINKKIGGDNFGTRNDE